MFSLWSASGSGVKARNPSRNCSDVFIVVFLVVSVGELADADVMRQKGFQGERWKSCPWLYPLEQLLHRGHRERPPGRIPRHSYIGLCLGQQYDFILSTLHFFPKKTCLQEVFISL